MKGKDRVCESLEKIARLDRDIRAFTCVAGPELTCSGTRSVNGPLESVPFAVKDMIDVKGVPTALGLTAAEYDPQAARSSAAVVERLAGTGAVFVGKTATSALAMDRPAPTRHPRDLSRSPGASSSGSAAAVAAGMVPLALGSQTIGSVIRPASYCGVWAFVPSLGAVPLDGTFWVSPSLERVGLFASSAQWLEKGGRTLLGTHTDADADRASERFSRPPRIGILHSKQFGLKDEGFLNGFDRLLKGFGDVFVRMDKDVAASRLLRVAGNIVLFEANRYLANRKAFIGQLKLPLAELVPACPPRRDYDEAIRERNRMADDWPEAISDLDAVLLPSAIDEAPVGAVDRQDTTPSAFGSLLGAPTLNVPLFTSRNGLPVGGQLIARRGQDLELLRLGVWLAKKFRLFEE